MGDQNDGQVENNNGAKPVAGSDALSGRTRTAPVISGHAVEIPAGEHEPAPFEMAEAEEKAEVEAETLSAEAEAPASEGGASSEADANAADVPVKSGSIALRAFGAAAVVLVVGAGGYYGWTELGGKKAVTDKFAAVTGAARPASPSEPATSADKKVEPAAAPAAPAEPARTGEAPAAATPEKASETAEAAEKTDAKPQPDSAAAAAASDKSAEVKAETSAPPSAGGQMKAEDLKKAENAPVAAEPANKPAESTPLPTAGSKTEATARAQDASEPSGAAPKVAETSIPAQPPAPNGAPQNAGGAEALAQMAAQLAATQSALQQVSQRLKTVENQLAAPKTEARAPLAARDAGPANTGDASARIVAAQSLLAALRQGEDYAPMLAALQNLGGDSGRLAKLRAGLASPTPAKLAEDFAALAPKIVASAAPATPQPTEARTPQGFGETAWAFLEVRLKKLVKIRPAGAPDQDATSARIDRIEKDLARNDIAGALAERAQLPAPTLSISADWSSAAQARLDAEEAAKAELAQSLQNLSKSKS